MLVDRLLIEGLLNMSQNVLFLSFYYLFFKNICTDLPILFEKTFAIINQSTLYEFLRSVNKMLNAVENNAELQD